MHGNWQNQLYIGDNLHIMRDWIRDASADLVYLDPPFNSKTVYQARLKPINGTGGAQIKAFDDHWEWDARSEETYDELVGCGAEPIIELIGTLRRLPGLDDMSAYLLMMAVRLLEIRRILKPTGTLYLHCDPTSSHYIKVLLDAIFGQKGFLNEIIWKYEGPQSPSPTRFATRHDVILRYARDPGRVDVTKEGLYLKTPMTRAEARKNRYRQDDEGRWYYDTPTGDYSEQSLIKLEQAGRIRRTGTGKRRVKYFLEQDEEGLVVRKKKLADVWDDIPSLGLAAASREKMGYPTQKPEALLERIIRADSKPGDLVVDAFCGCGTTLAMSEKLNRRWIGVDSAHLAITLARHRLASTFGSDLSPYRLKGAPEDVFSAQSFAEEDPLQFDLWALGLVEARPLGGEACFVDGIITFQHPETGQPESIIVRVFRRRITPRAVRALENTLNREHVSMGVILSLRKPTPAVADAAEAAGHDKPYVAGGNRYPRIQVLTIEELLHGRSPDSPKRMHSGPAP